MVHLGFKPGAARWQIKRNHGAMAATSLPALFTALVMLQITLKDTLV